MKRMLRGQRRKSSVARILWEGEEGITFIIAFVFMLTMVVMVASFLVMAAGETREIKGRIEVGKAFWFAEAGLHKGIWRLTTLPPQGSGSCFTTPGVIETLDEGSYTYRIQRVGNLITITSIGVFSGLPNYQYTVEQDLNRAGPPCPP